MHIFLFLKTFAFFDMFFFSFLNIHSATWDTFAISLTQNNVAVIS